MRFVRSIKAQHIRSAFVRVVSAQHPNSRGTSCFCHNLYSGHKERFRRPDILGTLEEKELPEWARLGLVQYRQSQREKKEAFREER